MSAGDFSFDGVFTMSRAHVTASPTVAPAVDRVAHAPRRPPTINVTFLSLVGVASPLYSRNW